MNAYVFQLHFSDRKQVGKKGDRVQWKFRIDIKPFVLFIRKGRERQANKLS